jgi:hypothetical protein
VFSPTKDWGSRGRNPGAIEAAIQRSADDVLFGKPGVDDQYGHRRINVAKALGL